MVMRRYETPTPLRLKRLALGYRQIDVVRKLERLGTLMGQSTYGDIELNRRVPTDTERNRIAKVLGAHVDDLWPTEAASKVSA